MDDRIFREMYVADRLRKGIAKMEKTPQTKKKRRRRHRAMLRKLQRMRNLVDNLPYNLIAWLVDTLKVILSLGLKSRMVKKKGRFIHKKTVRGMYSWPHYIFRQRLLCLGAPLSNHHMCFVENC